MAFGILMSDIVNFKSWVCCHLLFELFLMKTFEAWQKLKFTRQELRLTENLQEENVIVLEMILLTLQMTVLKTNFRTPLSQNFEIFPIFPKKLFSGCESRQDHYSSPTSSRLWYCDLVVRPPDTSQSYKSFAQIWLISQALSLCTRECFNLC